MCYIYRSMNRNWSLRLIAFLPGGFNEVSSNCVAKLTFPRFIDGLEGRFSSSQRELKIQSGSIVDFVETGLLRFANGLMVREGGPGGFDEVRARLDATFTI